MSSRQLDTGILALRRRPENTQQVKGLGLARASRATVKGDCEQADRSGRIEYAQWTSQPFAPLMTRDGGILLAPGCAGDLLVVDLCELFWRMLRIMTGNVATI